METDFSLLGMRGGGPTATWDMGGKQHSLLGMLGESRAGFLDYGNPSFIDGEGIIFPDRGSRQFSKL